MVMRAARVHSCKLLTICSTTHFVTFMLQCCASVQLFNHRSLSHSNTGFGEKVELIRRYKSSYPSSTRVSNCPTFSPTSPRFCSRMMSTDSLAFTEFEEGITFDVDDPDFVNSNITTSPATSATKATNNNKSCSLEALGE